MKKTIRLGSFLLAFLLLVCTLPVTAWAATTVDLNQNYLFRPRANAFSFGAGETATLTFTPQYTAEYTLNLYGYADGGGGRNIKASLTRPDGTVTDFEYPNHEGTTVKNYPRPYLTAKLEKGKTYTYSVWGYTAAKGATVDVNFTSSQSGALTEELGLRAYLPDKTFYSYDPQAVLNELKLLVGFKNATQPLEWYYKNAGGVLSINGVDVIVDMSGCGAEGMNTMAVYYQAIEPRRNLKSAVTSIITRRGIRFCPPAPLRLHALLLHHLRR